MEFIMVNSTSLGSERNGNTKASSMQANVLLNKTQSTSPLTATSATHSKNDFTETSGSSSAVEPTPSQTDSDENKTEPNTSTDDLNAMETGEAKKSLFCSFPLEKVQTILSRYTTVKSDGTKMKIPRKVMCLFCDRTFVNVNLRQKHVERCHSSKQLRRVSLRKHQNFLTSTPCGYCDKFTSTEHTLKDLFKHLVDNHSNKYFGCLSCEDRFLNISHLADHNALQHNLVTPNQKNFSDPKDFTTLEAPSLEKEETREEIPVKVTRRKLRGRKENKVFVVNSKKVGSNIDESVKSSNMKNLRGRKLSVKSSRMILKRSKRLQAKLNDTTKKRRTKDVNEKKKIERQEQTFSTKSNEKSTKVVNPYPEFDHFFQVKKITDHSIDNLKISSLTFDDVFDKAFFNRIKCNIQENLAHHIDGKLFKNEESESRISNFEKNINIPQETQNLNTENYGCEISLNAVAPTTMLLSNQLGDDPESQIEYGSKPSKKKTQLKKDEVHYKYFTRRKYQASILEHKENRDLSKLDMWTQYVIKNRQQKILDDKKSPKEILDYFAGEEYKSIRRREELNRILDRRGPFEDLKEEASKKAALDKLNGENTTDDDNFAEIGELLNDMLNRVFEIAHESSAVSNFNKNTTQISETVPEIPSYLNLRPTGSTCENEIDRSDKIALICSSQETENFELPSNTVRGKNEKVELTGEWARSRIFVCAACGLKLQNIKQFIEHKSVSHQYIWVQHYEFVGNQSELYRHLSIPVLGKVGVLENTVQCKVWKRSDARLCTKCGKQCNSLGELHRHILECGGDWTWMLARKKCKYRPFGAKSRRKRRGLVKRRIFTQKTEPTEKKVYKKNFDIPRQKPSDADSIKRMLANLPAKRATRKIICLKDGFNTQRTRQVKTTKQTKFKCGKLIHGKTKEQIVAKQEYEKANKNQNNYRRSLRCLNKVLTSRILDTNSSIMVRRKYVRKIKNEEKNKQNKRNVQVDTSQNPATAEVTEEQPKSSPRKNAKVESTVTAQNENQAKEEIKSKRTSPRIEKRSEFSAVEKMNIKRFFPVKKKKKINNHVENGKNTKVSESPGNNKPEKALLPESEEIKNGHVTSVINLRKRKSDRKNVQSESTGKPKVRKNSKSKKQKLKNNLKNVIVEPCAAEVTQNQEDTSKTETTDFFDDSDPKNDSENDLEPPKLEPEVPILPNEEKVEEEREKPELEESIPKIECSEENSKPESTTTLTTKQTKKKFRKPARGLNDCIAMLTSKLGKNFEDSTTNIFNEISRQSIQENVEIDVNKRPEYILKVPFSNEHFELRSCTEAECFEPKQKETSIGDGDDVNNLSYYEKVEETSVLFDQAAEQEQNCHEICETTLQEKESVQNLTIESNSVEKIPMEQCREEETKEINATIVNEEETVEKEILDTEEFLPLDKSNISSYITDSEDEIPLSSLLKEDQSEQDLSINRTSIEKESSLTNTDSCKEFNEVDAKISEEMNSDEMSTHIFKDILQLDEEVKIKEKDTVLMEINDNLCQHNEIVNYANTTTEIDTHKTTDKNRLVVPDLQKLTPVEEEEVDNLLALEEHLENHVFSKLGKMNFFQKNTIEPKKTNPNDIILEESPTVEEPIIEDIKSLTDCSEYKENSALLAEGKTKPKRKTAVSSKTKEKVDAQNKQDAKENVDSPRINGNKKSVRTAKAKALESILDDALLELSENELFLQDNLKNVISEVKEDSVEQLEDSPEKQQEVACTSKENEIGAEAVQIEELVEESTNNLDQQVTLVEDAKSEIDNGKELRRSSRNSRRVTCYNETDLVDPLLDDIENDKTISKILKETTKDIFGIKRKNRNKKMGRNGQNDRKLNGDELFDLLKTTPSENIVLSKPTNTFFNTFDEISNDFNDDNFDVLGDILEKSIAVIEENLSESAVPSLAENLSNTQQQINENSESKTASDEQEIKKKVTKKKSKKVKPKNKKPLQKVVIDGKIYSEQNSISCSDIDRMSNLESIDNNDLNSTELTQDENKVIYCEICDKSFTRMESLTKHKRTLTHISKLSELEAKEAALKAKSDQLSTNEESETTDSRKDLNILDILENIEGEEECKQFSSPFSVNVKNSNLKLADIINDVLNKPILKKDDDSHNFSEIMIQNETEPQPEIRRYKSLAERKSFEDEDCLKNDHVKSVDYFETEISNAAAGQILEKQITLLENIIENRSSISYIDEISISSTQSVNENTYSESGLGADNSKQVELDLSYSEQRPEVHTKPNFEENFLKPSQYEEISEDSNMRNYEEQKSRKALNRDEELFLECCSLLKSGSEVSSYSKKSNNLCKDLNHLDAKPSDEPDWLDGSCVSQKENCDFVECSSDSSCIRTPLGDGFSQDESNSATITSQWDMNNSSSHSKKESWKDLKIEDQNLTFEEVFNNNKKKEDGFSSREDEKGADEVSPFHRVISEVLKTDLNSSSAINVKKSNVTDPDDISRVSYENKDFKDAPSPEGKKMLTKGAMKVFEGLKVSIPTEELNMDKLLTPGPPPKPNSPFPSDVPFEQEKSSKPSKSNKRNSHHQKSPSKAKTKHGSKSSNFKKQGDSQMSSKIHDVYDFEETQDNSDVFTKPDFKSFRNTYKKSDKLEGSDDDSGDCPDGGSFDAFSSSTSSVSEVLPVKSRPQQNITKKKCMIMGRIFKNAVKSRIVDEDIRNIPIIDNTKLVEDFVLNCPEPVATSVEKKARMTEEEMNSVFDHLVKAESKSGAPKSSPDKIQHKNNKNKRKSNTKRKKSSYGSDSSDDEFQLQQSTKKRPKKKNNNSEESCINLEQELRECIGVASRKSQRKCTSGKQNVLMEYWSSDESSFETMLERQILESCQQNNCPVNDEPKQNTQVKEVKTNSTPEDSKVVESEVSHKKVKVSSSTSQSSNRRKRVAANPLYHWSSSSEDESRDLIEVRPIRDEIEDDEDRPVQHGWIVGDSPKKLVTMLAQAKGKKCETDGVKEHGKKRTFS